MKVKPSIILSLGLMLGLYACNGGFFDFIPGKNLIQTGEAIDIAKFEATLSGTVWPTTDMQEVKVGFLWSTSSQPTMENSTILRVEDWKPGQAFTYHLQDLLIGQTYYYKAYVQFDGFVYKFGEVKSFETLNYQYIAGDAIDLGLSVLWSSTNLGATAPEDVGAYFSWGESTPKSCYIESNYHPYPYTRDASTALLGDGWRMPTVTEMEELIDQCSWTLVTVNGVPCFRINPQNLWSTAPYILLPATGYYTTSLYEYWTTPEYRFNYWTGTFFPNDASNYESWHSPRFYTLYVKYPYGTSDISIGLSMQYEGLPIRPVKEKK